VFPVIVRAAIWRDGGVYSVPQPQRHHDVIALMRSYGIAQGSPALGLAERREIQGFLTDMGAFLDRVSAFHHAKAVGQLRTSSHGPELFSEDLW
jgi:hypothetical protein